MKTDRFYFFTGLTLKDLRRRKSIREKRKISQHIFASEINKPYGTVATWESKGVPKVEDAAIIAAYYEVPMPVAASHTPATTGIPENITGEPGGPYFNPAAIAVINSLNKIIESKDQIIAEKERVIVLLQEKLNEQSSR